MSKKILDLRGLGEADRDAKVNITVAHATQPIPVAITDEGVTGISDGWSAVEPLPPYATSADAVLPLLNECECDMFRVCGEEGFPETWRVKVNTGAPNGEGLGVAPIFPLAACYALLRANGYEVLT